MEAQFLRFPGTRSAANSVGVGTKQISIPKDPAMVSDKDVRAAVENVYKLRTQASEAANEANRLRAELAHAEHRITLGAALGGEVDVSELEDLRARSEAADRRSKIFEAASPAAVDAYVEACRKASAWRGKIVAERDQQADRAAELLKGAFEAAMKAQRVSQLATTFTNPHASFGPNIGSVTDAEKAFAAFSDAIAKIRK